MSAQSFIEASAKNVLKRLPFRLLAGAGTPILTYHSCSPVLPPYVPAVDNTPPDLLYVQLETLKRHYRVIPVDELLEQPSARGVAAVTFDDGYKNTLEHALPVCEALEIPFTVFVNSFSMEGRTFWRHKVAHVVSHHLADECRAFLKGIRFVEGTSFPDSLKHYTNDSRVVEAQLDEFLARKGMEIRNPRYFFDDASHFVAHRLVWYGNHTHDHYVMASLPFDEQLRQLQLTEQYLKRMPGIQLSRAFAPPFGQAQHVNLDTFSAASELGYQAVVLNRGRINFGIQRVRDVILGERFSPASGRVLDDYKKRFAVTVARRAREVDPRVDRPRNAHTGIRIAHVINALVTGGAERLASDLCFELERSGHSVHLICLRGIDAPPVAPDEFRRAGIPVVQLGKPEGFHLPTLYRMARYLKAHRIDVVHTHNPLVHHYGAWGARLAGVPSVVNTVHGINTLKMAGWAQRVFDISCAVSDRVVSVCEAVEQAVKKGFPCARGKSMVIENGIQLGPYLAIAPRRPDGLFLFGSIGRLDPVKDQAGLLEAFALLVRRNPRCRLELLGGGDLEADLRNRAEKLGISSAVRFLGWSRQPAAYLKNWDAFVLSSISEGLPLTILEAMAAGLPVVATAVGGIPAVLAEAGCGWLCEPRNPKALASAMESLLNTPNLREQGARGRTFVERRYSGKTMTEQYLQLYTELLSADPKWGAGRVSPPSALRGRAAAL